MLGIQPHSLLDWTKSQQVAEVWPCEWVFAYDELFKLSLFPLQNILKISEDVAEKALSIPLQFRLDLDEQSDFHYKWNLELDAEQEARCVDAYRMARNR